MYQLLELINNLETELKKIDNTESISLRISKPNLPEAPHKVRSILI